MSLIKDGKSSISLAFCIDVLLFADKVKKTNKFYMTQERSLVITNKAIYNINKN